MSQTVRDAYGLDLQDQVDMESGVVTRAKQTEIVGIEAAASAAPRGQA